MHFQLQLALNNSYAESLLQNNVLISGGKISHLINQRLERAIVFTVLVLSKTGVSLVRITIYAKLFVKSKLARQECVPPFRLLLNFWSATWYSKTANKRTDTYSTHPCYLKE